jgi:hypothetical protein
MKFRPLPALLITAALISAALTGCFQELPLGDKYLNEAVGFLRVQNTSTAASYVFRGFELRNEAGEVIKTWDGLNLERGGIWTGDVDKEGSFLLYCMVWNEDEQAAGRYEYGTVAIKLHEVTESKIIGETFFTDSDGDGFSDTWELAYDFDPENNADGGPVYVVAKPYDSNDNSLGTAASPYKSLTKGLWKAKYGLTDEARTVIAQGVFNNTTEGASNTALLHITDTGPWGITIRGVGLTVDAAADNSNMRRPFYLRPGTKLNLENIIIKNGRMFQGTGIYADGAALILGSGAVIQNCSGSASGAVYGSNGAVITMESGSLIGDDDVGTSGSGYDKANDGWVGVGVTVINGSSLTMKGGSRITGNSFLGGGAVYADLGSSITLEPGAAITNNKNRDPAALTTSHGGGVRLTRGSKLLMKGGLIAGNVITKDGVGGGGVYVGAESVFEMRGGKISGNIVGQIDDTSQEVYPNPIGNGGGVYVDAGGQFNMSGGEIASNTASGQGGGVYIESEGRFSKTGGTVYGTTDPGSQNTMGTPFAVAGNAIFAKNPSRSINETLSNSDSITL